MRLVSYGAFCFIRMFRPFTLSDGRKILACTFPKVNYLGIAEIIKESIQTQNTNTQEESTIIEKKLCNPKEIQIEQLHSFQNHPYKVLDNEEMETLAESIRTEGILSPLIVRPLENTDEYEIISGHRRLYAAQKAGLEKVPALIYEISREEVAILLVDSNLHREHILPSEKAFAYKLKMEALSHQGTSGQLGQKWSREQIDEQESGRQVQRYIRLTFLIPELLQLVDGGKIALTPAVELSYLPKNAQAVLLEEIHRNDCTPSLSQAVRLKKQYQAETLTAEGIREIMSEEKANQQEKISFRAGDLRKFFPKSYSTAQMQETILRLLTDFQRKRQRSPER